MPKQSAEQNSLFALIEGGQSKPTLSHLSDARADARTPEPVKLSEHKGKIRTPARTPGRPESTYVETDWPSRLATVRPHARLNAQLMFLVAKEMQTEYPPLKISVVLDDGLRLWLHARARSRSDARTPASSSSGSCSDPDLKDLITTTTTTTPGSRQKSPPLPGFAADVLSLVPHKSAHSRDVNLAYAWESHRNGEGIKSPDLWAMSNYRSGKFDALIDLWLERKRVAEEEAARRLAEIDAQAEAARQRVEQHKAEFEGRQDSKPKWRQP